MRSDVTRFSEHPAFLRAMKEILNCRQISAGLRQANDKHMAVCANGGV